MEGIHLISLIPEVINKLLERCNKEMVEVLTHRNHPMRWGDMTSSSTLVPWKVITSIPQTSAPSRVTTFTQVSIQLCRQATTMALHKTLTRIWEAIVQMSSQELEHTMIIMKMCLTHPDNIKLKPLIHFQINIQLIKLHRRQILWFQRSPSNTIRL